MNERDRITDDGLPPDDEESVRRLLEEAGPREEIPAEDLAAIEAAARFGWKRQLRELEEERRRQEPAAAEPLREPAEEERRRPGRARRAAVVLALAASLLVAAGLGWWWVVRSGGSVPAAPAVVAMVEAVTGPVRITTGAEAPRALAAGDPIPLGSELRSGGERTGRAALRLLDGAAIRLDTGTALRLASASALELQRGAIYVDTEAGAGAERAPGRRAAIEIRTPLGAVRDIGTRFAVRVVEAAGGAAGDGAQPALQVLVRDGAVQTEHRGRTYLTSAGQELVLHAAGAAERRAIAAYGPAWEWVMEAAGGFDVEGRSLREFLDWIARETGWRIVIEDTALARSAARIVLHGSIGGLRADDAVFAVLPGAGLEAELRDGTLFVRRAAEVRTPR